MRSEKEYLKEILYDFFTYLFTQYCNCEFPLIYEFGNGIRPQSPFFSLQFNDVAMLGTNAYVNPLLEHRIEEIETDDGNRKNKILNSLKTSDIPSIRDISNNNNERGGQNEIHFDENLRISEKSSVNRETFVQKIVLPIERTMTLRGFGEETEEVINTVRTFLEFDEVNNLLRKHNVAIRSVENVIENATNYSEDDEVFYSLDFTLSYCRIAELEMASIDKVKLNEAIKDIDNEIKVSGVLQIERAEAINE